MYVPFCNYFHRVFGTAGDTPFLVITSNATNDQAKAPIVGEKDADSLIGFTTTEIYKAVLTSEVFPRPVQGIFCWN